MALNTLLMLAAVAGGGAQDPSMDLQIAAPMLAAHDEAPQAPAPVVVTAQAPVQVVSIAQEPKLVEHVSTTVQGTGQGQRVTVQFRNAKAEEVLRFLENKGVNFVIADKDMPKNETITVNAQDQPVENVLDAIASALGGHWENQRGVRVFRKGPGTYFRVQGAREALGAPRMMTPPDVKFYKFDEKDAKAFKFDAKEFEKQFGPDFQKRMERVGVEMEKKFGPGSDFQKQMEKLGREHGSKVEIETYRLSEGQREQIRRDAARAREEARGEAARARAEGARIRVEGDRIRREALRQFRVNGNDSRVRIVRPGTAYRPFSTAGGAGIDATSILKSLSDDQKHRQRTRGFLRYDDLTREQKRLLGDRPDGRFEYRFKVNGEEVVIKGE